MVRCLRGENQAQRLTDKHMHVTEVALAPEWHFTDYINKILIYYNRVCNEHVRCVMAVQQNCMLSHVFQNPECAVFFFLYIYINKYNADTTES